MVDLRRSLTYTFEFRSVDPALSRHAVSLLADFAPPVPPTVGAAHAYLLDRRAGPGTHPHFELRRDGTLLGWNFERARVVEQLVREVSRATLARSTRDFLLVHAGVAAAPDGGAVVLTGESGSGKTTIVAALVQEGFRYLSDETAVVDPETSVVRPWARPLDFKPAAQTIERFRDLFETPGERAWHVPAERLRQGALGTACPARVIVDYRYVPGHPTTLERISRGEALAVLGSAAPGLREHGRPGLQALRELLRGASAYRLRAGELEQAIRRVRSIAEAAG